MLTSLSTSEFDMNGINNIMAILFQVEYFNNKKIVDLVEAQHKGVLAILDEACLNVGKVTDKVSSGKGVNGNGCKMNGHVLICRKKFMPMLSTSARQGSAIMPSLSNYLTSTWRSLVRKYYNTYSEYPSKPSILI